MFCIFIEVANTNGAEFQSEKSISNHDQGKTTRKPSQRKQRHRRRHKNQRKKKRQLDSRIRAHNFNAFDADYVDFGALIGQDGAFSWHANYSPD